MNEIAGMRRLRREAARYGKVSREDDSYVDENGAKWTPIYTGRGKLLSWAMEI